MTLHRGSGGRGSRSSERRELVTLGQLSESEDLYRSLFSIKLGLLVWTSKSWGRGPHSVSILSYVLQFECEMPPQAHPLNTWSSAVSAIGGGYRNIGTWDIANKHMVRGETLELHVLASVLTPSDSWSSEI